MIYSGSMSLTGSLLEDSPAAALLFENDGTMRLLIMENDDQDEKSLDGIILVSEFFEYALSKDEWMKEYVDLAITKNNSSINKKYQPVLKLIHGGLSNITGSIDRSLLN